MKQTVYFILAIYLNKFKHNTFWFPTKKYFCEFYLFNDSINYNLHFLLLDKKMQNCFTVSNQITNKYLILVGWMVGF